MAFLETAAGYGGLALLVGGFGAGCCALVAVLLVVFREGRWR